MKKTAVPSLLAFMLVILCNTGILLAQETTIKLPTSDDSSSFNVTDSNDDMVLRAEANGNVDVSGAVTATAVDVSGAVTATAVDVSGVVTAATFVGDGSNLSNVRPVAAYTDGGNWNKMLSDNTVVCKYIDITVPSQGVIVVTAYGFIHWDIGNPPPCTLSISAGLEHELGHLIQATYYGNDDPKYTPISITRGFTVNSGGTYRFNFLGDCGTDEFIHWQTNVHSQLTAMFFPTGGVAASKPAIQGMIDEADQ